MHFIIVKTSHEPKPMIHLSFYVTRHELNSCLCAVKLENLISQVEIESKMRGKKWQFFMKLFNKILKYPGVHSTLKNLKILEYLFDFFKLTNCL